MNSFSYDPDCYKYWEETDIPVDTEYSCSYQLYPSWVRYDENVWIPPLPRPNKESHWDENIYSWVDIKDRKEWVSQ